MNSHQAGDRGLRDLERRAAAGEVEAQAELLIARHRLGRLPEERLRLAAHLEDPAAVIAAGEILGVAPRRKNLGTWIRRIGTPDLSTWERELPWKALVQPTCVRIAFAALELALPVWNSAEWKKNVDPGDTKVDLVVQTHRNVKAWLEAPSDSLAARTMGPFMMRPWSGVTAEAAAELASCVSVPSYSLMRSPERELGRSAAKVVELAAQTLEWSEVPKAEAEARIRTACRDAALPFLLWA